MYIYEVYARHPKLPPNEPGNFIYAKMDEHKRWKPIYIGEGNLTQRAEPDLRGMACIDAKGATHVHLHVNYEHDDRIADVNDLCLTISPQLTGRTAATRRRPAESPRPLEKWSGVMAQAFDSHRVRC